MAQLRRDHEEFVRRNAVVVAVAPDGQGALGAYWHKRKMPFAGLADPEHRVADLYAQDVNLLRLGRMPALFVVDSGGTVRYAHYATAMYDIPANRDILQVLDDLAREERSRERPSSGEE